MIGKLFKLLGIALGCIMILGVVVMKVGRPIWENSFAGQVASANCDCPIPIAGGKGLITSICLEDNFLTYYLNYDKGSNLLTALGEDKFKEALLLSMICLNGQGDHQGDMLMSKLAEEQCGLKIVVSCSGVKQFEGAASIAELQALRQACTQNPHEAFHSLLLLQIEVEKDILPKDVFPGLELLSVGLEGENVCITMRLDEEKSGFTVEKFFKCKAPIHWGFVKERLTKDSEIRPLLELCKVSHTGIVYRIVGKHINQKVTLSPGEIRQKVSTPSSVSIQ